jgi:hypothetical protein
MHKISGKKIKMMFNILFPSLLIVSLYVAFRFVIVNSIKLFKSMNAIEGMTNNIDTETQANLDLKKSPFLCADNDCAKGCTKPNEISDRCPKTVYKDVDGICHRKCPYECPNALDKCKFNECCAGCGYTKIQVKCPGPIKLGEIEYSYPSPYADKSTALNNSKKQFDMNLTPMEDGYRNNLEISPYTSQYPCGLNVTGTFTECGPPAYNSCNL